MGELLSAIRRGEEITAHMLERALSHVTAIRLKTESSQPNVPESLREVWRREDAEAALLADEEIEKSEVLPKQMTKRELERFWKREDEELEKYKEEREVS